MQFWLAAQGLYRRKFRRERPVGEEGVQGLVAGGTQVDRLPSTFRLRDEVMARDLLHFPLAQRTKMGLRGGVTRHIGVSLYLRVTVGKSFLLTIDEK